MEYIMRLMYGNIDLSMWLMVSRGISFIGLTKIEELFF